MNAPLVYWAVLGSNLRKASKGWRPGDEAIRRAPTPPLIPARLGCAQPWGAPGHTASRTSAPAALTLQGEAADKQDLQKLILGGRHPKA